MDDDGLRQRRPTRTQADQKEDYKRAPSLRRTKSGASVASPPEIARVRSFGLLLSKRSRKLRRRLRRRYNRAAEAFELLHRAQIEQRRFLMAHPTALWRVLWRFFVFCLLVGRFWRTRARRGGARAQDELTAVRGCRWASYEGAFKIGGSSSWPFLNSV